MLPVSLPGGTVRRGRHRMPTAAGLSFNRRRTVAACHVVSSSAAKSCAASDDFPAVVEICCAARNISVAATVRRFQPADSAMSSKPVINGCSTLRHSDSCIRKSFAGCVGEGTGPIPSGAFIGFLLNLLRCPPLRGGAGKFVDDQKSMPPPGIAGADASFLGFWATIASVVTSSPATDAASCNAVRTTFAGSITPWP